jgi:hypothetical protein
VSCVDGELDLDKLERRRQGRSVYAYDIFCREAVAATTSATPVQKEWSNPRSEWLAKLLYEAAKRLLRRPQLFVFCLGGNVAEYISLQLRPHGGMSSAQRENSRNRRMAVGAQFAPLDKSHPWICSQVAIRVKGKGKKLEKGEEVEHKGGQRFAGRWVCEKCDHIPIQAPPIVWKGLAGPKWQPSERWYVPSTGGFLGDWKGPGGS